MPPKDKGNSSSVGGGGSSTPSETTTQQKTTVTETQAVEIIETTDSGEQEDPEPLQITRFGGRKFIFVMFLSVIFTALKVGEYIDQNVFAVLMGGLATAYLGVNIYQKVKGK